MIDKRIFVTTPKANKVTSSYEEQRLKVHEAQPNTVTRNLQGLVVQQSSPRKLSFGVKTASITVQQQAGTVIQG